MQSLPSVKEQLSALQDGELGAEQLDVVLGAVARDSNLLLAWQQAHWLGDSLRDASTLAPTQGTSFWDNLEMRLQGEPAWSRCAPGLLAPVLTAPNAPAWWKRETANAALFQKTAALALAGVCLVLMSWSLLTYEPLDKGVVASSQVAADAALDAGATLVEDTQTGLLRDPRLDALLAAHRQQGGVSHLHVSSSYLQHAGLDMGSR